MTQVKLASGCLPARYGPNPVAHPAASAAVAAAAAAGVQFLQHARHNLLAIRLILFPVFHPSSVNHFQFRQQIVRSFHLQQSIAELKASGQAARSNQRRLRSFAAVGAAGPSLLRSCAAQVLPVNRTT